MNGRPTFCRLAAFLLSLALLPPCLAAEPEEPGMFARSVVSAGDTTRLQQVFTKARRGEAITVGVIGGSITEGAKASQPEKCYGQRVAAWWRKTFPQAQVQFVNAGIGATGSDFGALRVRRDLLARSPDFVLVEFAVNDPNEKRCAETLEGLLRQILSQSNSPAVVLLFTMHDNGSNAQEWHGKVGQHYNLPMISFRDALWPEIQAGRLKRSNVEADQVHPNDRGHDYAARFVTTLLQNEIKESPTSKPVSRIKRLPAPLISDLYEHVTLLDAAALAPVSNQGWRFDEKGRTCWRTDQPGSVIEFEISGQAISIMDWHFRGPQGRAKVQVDEIPPVTRDGWFEGTWGGYRGVCELARGLQPGKHRVRIELLAEKNPQSTGYEFKVLGLGAAGVAK
jgi:lysophospholipase L1-like esterase